MAVNGNGCKLKFTLRLLRQFITLYILRPFRHRFSFRAARMNPQLPFVPLCVYKNRVFRENTLRLSSVS